MSHDLNRDPEMWEFRDLIGQRADAIWMELLSIADRNEGYLPGNWSDYPRLLAGTCHSTPSRVRLALEWLTTPRGRHLRPWVTADSEKGASITNYLEYHRTREPKQAPSEPSDPNLPILRVQNPPSAAASLQFLPPKEKPKTLDGRIKTWADQIYQIDTKKYNRLITWIKAAERTYPVVIIATSLEKFLPFAREVAQWWPYLDKILDKEEARYNGSHTQQKSDRIKRQERIWLKG